MADTNTVPSAARAAMDSLNGEAEGLHIWLRTQANAPAQRPWFHDGGLDAGGQVAAGRVGANQMKAAPHRWRWSEIGPYLGRIAEIARNAGVSPIEFADRQQFLLVNPGLSGGLSIAWLANSSGTAPPSKRDTARWSSGWSHIALRRGSKLT